jgi:hypothetical protein
LMVVLRNCQIDLRCIQPTPEQLFSLELQTI